MARVGSGPTVGHYLCGAFHFGAPGDHPLLSALPAVIQVRPERGALQPWLVAHLDAVACEARSGRPGGMAVIARLSEVLFVQAIRYHLAELPASARGWLGALRDPQLARAVGLIHRHPDRPWTVATLAGEAGLSRSQFAERFAAVVGRPPLTYLAEWRMHRGRVLLRDGALRVGEVARRVGYGSEAAFSTAFRRAAGVAPGAYRRAAVAG
jgi:AraC-like DNA-binding protein